MSLFRGLFVRPDSTRGTTPVEARKALAGMFQRLPDGSPRPGLLAPAQIVGTAGWAYSVPAVPMLLARGTADGVVLAGNDGTLSVTTDPAPATGSRIDIVYAIHHDVDNADGDSEMVVDVEIGDPSGTPVAPSIPAGAMELARATVPSTAANTLGATISQTAPIAAVLGADFQVPNVASLARIVNPVAGMRAVVAADGSVRTNVDGTTSGWVPIRPDTAIAGRRSGGSSQSIPNAVVTELNVGSTADHLQGGVALSGNGLSVSVSGWYQVSAGLRWGTDSAGTRQMRLLVNGNTYLLDLTTDTGSAVNLVSTQVWLAAGDVVTIAGYQSSGVSHATNPNFGMPFISLARIGG